MALLTLIDYLSKMLADMKMTYWLIDFTTGLHLPPSWSASDMMMIIRFGLAGEHSADAAAQAFIADVALSDIIRPPARERASQLFITPASWYWWFHVSHDFFDISTLSSSGRAFAASLQPSSLYVTYRRLSRAMTLGLIAAYARYLTIDGITLHMIWHIPLARCIIFDAMASWRFITASFQCLFKMPSLN